MMLNYMVSEEQRGEALLHSSGKISCQRGWHGHKGDSIHAYFQCPLLLDGKILNRQTTIDLEHLMEWWDNNSLLPSIKQKLNKIDPLDSERLASKSSYWIPQTRFSATQCIAILSDGVIPNSLIFLYCIMNKLSGEVYVITFTRIIIISRVCAMSLNNMLGHPEQTWEAYVRHIVGTTMSLPKYATPLKSTPSVNPFSIGNEALLQENK